MACCGKNRKKKIRKPVLVQYTGHEEEYTLPGTMSGKSYKFRGHGARLEMDKRDFNALMNNKVISKI
jgi:hypothetical protein